MSLLFVDFLFALLWKWWHLLMDQVGGVQWNITDTLMVRSFKKRWNKTQKVWEIPRSSLWISSSSQSQWRGRGLHDTTQRPPLEGATATGRRLHHPMNDGVAAGLRPGKVTRNPRKQSTVQMLMFQRDKRQIPEKWEGRGEPLTFMSSDGVRRVFQRAMRGTSPDWDNHMLQKHQRLFTDTDEHLLMITQFINGPLSPLKLSCVFVETSLGGAQMKTELLLSRCDVMCPTGFLDA